jgi:pyruvate dehydrogenase E2 component (dihydrolipoamide acetyltransferase)
MAERTFALPDLGEGLQEATVDAWLVRVGDVVELNQPIAEIETAKATVEVPSPYAGRVVRIHATVGETTRVGDPLVTIETAADDASASRDAGSRGTGRRSPVPAAPAVRSLARDLGVDLTRLKGSGPSGRVTREDVEGAAAVRAPSAAAVAEGDETEPVTAVRRTAAVRLTRAAAVPTVTTWRTVDCSGLERIRAEHGLSPLPFVVRALADVCVRHPMMNASWAETAIVRHDHVHVGIATDTDGGLLVPVVRDADRLGVRAIADRIRELAAAARGGGIAPAELSGQTITVTNTGSYGSEAGTPLLNVPDAVIVALGSIAKRALVVDGDVVARPACTLSVTFDHRVADGATIGRALGDLVAVLEDEAALRALPGL